MVMTVKFYDEKQNNVLEIEKNVNTVSFNIYQIGEEQVGQFIEVPMKEVQNIIKYLQSIQLYQ